jgi:hypothetical protein
MSAGGRKHEHRELREVPQGEAPLVGVFRAVLVVIVLGASIGLAIGGFALLSAAMAGVGR